MHGITCHGSQCQSWDFNSGLLTLSQPWLWSLCNSAMTENYPHGANCTFGNFQGGAPLHAEVTFSCREQHPVPSSQDLPGTCMIQNLCKKEWTGLGGHSVPLENLQNVIYYSRLFHAPMKPPCQSMQSGFWSSSGAETNSWPPHCCSIFSQIPGGHLSLQQPHCLQGNPVNGGISSPYSPSWRFFIVKGWSKLMWLAIQYFYPNSNSSALTKWKKSFASLSLLNSCLIVRTNYISVPKFRLLL